MQDFQSPSNTHNAFYFWDVQSPPGFIVSIAFEQIDVSPPWDEYTYISFGDGVETFTDSQGSCVAWSKLTDDRGNFKPAFRKFSSRTSSAKLIFASLTTRVDFLIKVSAVRPRGTLSIIVLLPFSLKFNFESQFKLM